MRSVVRTTARPSVGSKAQSRTPLGRLWCVAHVARSSSTDSKSSRVSPRKCTNSIVATMKAIVVSNADGELGRCDAKCHNAPPHTRCRCVCGGALHGIGTVSALAKAQAVADLWAMLPTVSVELSPMARQCVLFEDDTTM